MAFDLPFSYLPIRAPSRRSPASPAVAPVRCTTVDPAKSCEPRLAKFNGVGQGGLFYTGSFHQLGAQAIAVGASFVTVFVLSYSLFWIIKKTVGLRVSAREELEGLDISEHGMWGYPESFMPVPGGVYRPADTPTVNPHALHEPAPASQGVASA